MCSSVVCCLAYIFGCSAAALMSSRLPFLPIRIIPYRAVIAAEMRKPNMTAKPDGPNNIGNTVRAA